MLNDFLPVFGNFWFTVAAFALAISVIVGADPSDNLIVVAIVPVATEAEALIAAELLRTEVLGMLLS